MEDRFYLSSQDWGEPWGPRNCEYLAAHKAEPTGQLLFLVRVTPALPKELGEDGNNINKILLGPVRNDWTIKDIGRFPFMVDIYIPKVPLNRTAIHVKHLMRVGVGKLHRTRQEAESG